MLTKPLIVGLAFFALAGQLGVTQPEADGPPWQQDTGKGSQPALQAPPQADRPGNAPTKKHLRLDDLFQNESKRKGMGLEKLDPEEQQRLADAIVELSAAVLAVRTSQSALRQEAVFYLTRQGWVEDPEQKMRQEGWEEVEVVGVISSKSERFVNERDFLVVRV